MWKWKETLWWTLFRCFALQKKILFADLKTSQRNILLHRCKISNTPLCVKVFAVWRSLVILQWANGSWPCRIFEQARLLCYLLAAGLWTALKVILPEAVCLHISQGLIVAFVGFVTWEVEKKKEKEASVHCVGLHINVILSGRLADCLCFLSISISVPKQCPGCVRACCSCPPDGCCTSCTIHPAVVMESQQSEGIARGNAPLRPWPRPVTNKWTACCLQMGPARTAPVTTA